jgi:hypothetical protein
MAARMEGIKPSTIDTTSQVNNDPTQAAPTLAFTVRFNNAVNNERTKLIVVPSAVDAVVTPAATKSRRTFDTVVRTEIRPFAAEPTTVRNDEINVLMIFENVVIIPLRLMPTVALALALPPTVWRLRLKPALTLRPSKPLRARLRAVASTPLATTFRFLTVVARVVKPRLPTF